MNLNLKQIAKKHGVSYPTAGRKMRNQKPVSNVGYGRRYSPESVLAAFAKEKKEAEVVAEVRNSDCVDYMACLTKAAKLDLREMDCGICKKYESERD